MPDSSTLIIRDATLEDVPQILHFIRALAEYEREPHAVETTEADLRRDGFGAEARFRTLLAEYEGAAAGIALFFPIYSTWTGPGIHLEDLFVPPIFRGKGIGKALLARVAAIAYADGCRRLQWDVLEWNTPAIRFYESVGAEAKMEWRTMRVTGAKLSALRGASSDPVSTNLTTNNVPSAYGSAK